MMAFRTGFAVMLVLMACCAPRARAEDALPGKPYKVCAEFVTNPTAVVVDVQEIGGSQIGNNVAATRGTLDSQNASYWCVDLNAVSGFADTCDQKTYAVRFVPDAADCAAAVTPDSCATAVVASGGPLCWGFGDEPTVFYTVSPIPGRGLTATVIAKGNPSYMKHDVKLDNGGAAVFTWYQIFYYDTSGRVDHTVRSATPPSP